MESATNNLISSIEIDFNFKVIMTDSQFEPTKELSLKVDEIWHSALFQNRNLFDGNTLAVSSGTATELSCFSVPYRYFYAQEKDKEIKEQLQLKVAAVSGLLIVEGRVIVGRRSSMVTQCKDLFELVPSGSLSYSVLPEDGQIDYTSQLLLELSEEIGIDSVDTNSVEPCFLITDELTGVVDICCKISAERLTVIEVLRNFQSAEYTAIKAYSMADLFAMVKADRQGWVPTSAYIIKELARAAL